MNILRQITSHIFVLLALFTLLSGPVAAQHSPSPSLSPPASVPGVVQKSPVATMPMEIAVLKAQLQTMQSFTDRLITTVYWSLGSVVVIATLLVGFGWFTSVRLHDRDISAMRTELTGSLQLQLAAIRTELEKLVQDKITELTTSSAQAATVAVSKETKPIRLDVTSLRGSLSALQKQVAYMEFQSSAWYWEGRGVKSNEFTQYFEILRLATRENDSNQISRALKKLETLLKDGAQIFVSKITDVSALLDSLPSEYAIPAAALREALKTAETY